MAKYVDTPPPARQHPHRPSKHRDTAAAAQAKPSKWVVLEYANHSTAATVATQIRHGYGTVGSIYAEFGRFAAQIRRSSDGASSLVYVRWLGER